MYRVLSTDTFDRRVKKKHRDKMAQIRAIIENLEENPEYGKPLRGRLHGTWQIKIGPFRIWYEINASERTVILKAILHKDEAVKYY